jgi:hypothetical protein
MQGQGPPITATKSDESLKVEPKSGHVVQDPFDFYYIYLKNKF